MAENSEIENDQKDDSEDPQCQLMETAGIGVMLIWSRSFSLMLQGILMFLGKLSQTPSKTIDIKTLGEKLFPGEGEKI